MPQTGSAMSAHRRRAIVDLVGQRSGRLTVLEQGNNERGRTRWLCKCRLRHGWPLEKALTEKAMTRREAARMGNAAARHARNASRHTGPHIQFARGDVR